MENVLDVYKRPYDRDHPVVCMDESSRQLIEETRVREPMVKVRTAKKDYEYKRCGVYNVFMANEPLRGKRYTKVTEK